MPNENETRPCPHCDGTQTFMRNAHLPGSQAGPSSERGPIWANEKQPAWICDKNREHFELVPS
jgi:hypothetical protein